MLSNNKDKAVCRKVGTAIPMRLGSSAMLTSTVFQARGTRTTLHRQRPYCQDISITTQRDTHRLHRCRQQDQGKVRSQTLHLPRLQQPCRHSGDKSIVGLCLMARQAPPGLSLSLDVRCRILSRYSNRPIPDTMFQVSYQRHTRMSEQHSSMAPNQDFSCLTRQ